MRSITPRGSAIFLALIMMIGALAVLMGVLSSSTNNVVKHEQYSGREATYFAAEGVISQVWGRMYNPIALKLYTDGGIQAYLGTGSQVDPNSPYQGSFAMPNASPNTFASNLPTWSDWHAVPNVDSVPVVAYTNNGFKLGGAYIVDVQARWRRDIAVASDSTKTTTWTVTVRATTQNKYDSANPTWYDPNDPPAIVSQTFQFSQSNRSTVLNYVNLARNVSCTLCHAQFQNVLSAFNQDAINKINAPGNAYATPASVAFASALEQKWGTYPKVKLGTLGNFQVRDLNTVDPTLNGRFYPSDSLLDGTLYSRGIVQDNDHNALTSIKQEALQASQFDATNPDNIYQNKLNNGGENYLNMQQASYGPDGNPLPHANLYLNYPNSTTVNTVSGGTMSQSDGVMPDDFPYPFDPNVPNSLTGYSAQQLQASTTNRLVDGPKVDNWVQQRTDPKALNDPSNPNRLGTMTGGFAMVVDNTGAIVSAPKVSGTYQSITNDSKLPNVATDTRLLPSQDPAVGGSGGIVNGNLILVGTKDNPVNLNSQVLVKGDVIVKGYYTGVGSMWATGNIYLPSDLRYRDQPLQDSTGAVIKDSNNNPIEDFGNLNSKSSPENLGGMIAGGTIVIGDYLTSSLSSAPTSSSYTTNLPPDTNGVRENSFPLVPTYQKADPNFTYDYRTLNPATGLYDVSQQNLFAKNFTLSQMELFNRDEWGHTQQFLPNGSNGQFDVPNAQYGQFNPVQSTYDSSKPYMPRYYVLNPGDPVGAFVYGSQSTSPAQKAIDATNRVGTEGSYWSNGTPTEPPMWKGGEMSKVYNTTTIGGDPSQGSNGSIVNGTASNLVYDATKTTLVNSGDPTNTQKAAVIAINPQWLGSTPDKSTNTMWSFLLNEEWDRKFNTSSSQAVYASTADATPSSSARDGTPFRLDGLFYTNNAIFGIQRNRSLAPQAAGDYNDKNGPITTGPQAPDPTKPGSWQTPVPVVSYQYDNYQGNVVYDTYSSTLFTDHYKRTPYVDNFSQPAFYDTYTKTPYTDHYTQPQKYDVYTQTPKTDNYSQTDKFDNYSRTAKTDTYSQTQKTDTWQRTPNTDNYTQAVRTVTWTLYTGSGYSRQGPFTVTQVSPPGTIAQPATASNGQAVTQATSSEVDSTNTSSSAVYYNAGTPPAVPTGWTKAGTTVGAVQTLTSAPYTGAAPAVPATYTFKSTATNTVTSTSAVYYGTADRPATPTGWTFTSTATGATTTAKSANYTTTPPAVPSGYTVTSTSTTTITSSSAPYFGAAPAVPPGWTFVSTTVGATATSQSANYTGSAPAVPPNWTFSNTVTFTATSTSAVYYSPATQPPVPTGWTFVNTTTGATVTKNSANYTGAAPAVPANYTKTGTVSTTNTQSSSTYYDPANHPAVPTGYTLASTSTGASQSTASAPYRTGAKPALPAGYTVDSAAYPPIGTTQTTTTANTANYMQGTTPPPPPTNYIASEKTGTVTGNPPTATIQVPYGSAAPAGYPTKLAPTNPTYAYPANTAGTNAKDFKKYAKEMPSSSEGVMVVNGALVAPDLGLLVTGRKSAKNPYTLIMNYDERVRRLVQFVSNTPDTKWNLQIKGWTRLMVGQRNQ